MTSRISSFNIAKEDMRHRTWMLAMSILGNVLSLPVLFLLMNHTFIERMERYTSSERALTYLSQAYTELFNSYFTVAQGLILMFGAVIVAFFGFRYLYSRRMVDLYHSIPVKRTKLFFITYVNGFLIWVIPMLISMLLTIILLYSNLVQYGLTASFGPLCALAWSNTWRFILAFLIMYHFALVCVMLSGNIFNAICSTAIGGTLVFALYALLANGYASTFFYTHNYMTDEPLYKCSIFSPLVNAILVLVDCKLPIFWVGSVISAIVCLIVAWLLYLHRPSELAERGIENAFVQHGLRIATSVLGGLTGAIIFVAILDKDATAWHLFGAILVGVLCFGVLNCIFHMNFRSFLSHKLEMLGTVVLTCVILLAFKGDWFGYDEYIPDKEDIVSASMYYYDYSDQNGYWWYNINEEDNEMVYTDVDVIYNLLCTMTSPSHLGELDTNYDTFDLEVTLKNGKTFTRMYRILPEDAEVIRPIIESPEYQSVAYAFSSGNSEYPAELSIYTVLQGTTDSITDAGQIQQIVDAYRADFAEHSTMDKLGIGLYLGEIQIRTYEDNYSYYRCSPVIWSDYTRTIAVLKELYPNMAITKDDVTITSLTIDQSFDSRIPSDILYSYYGIEGYEDFNSYYDRLTQALDEEDAAANASSTVETARAYESTFYQLTITDMDELEKYKDSLYLCEYDGYSFFYDSRDYVYVGDALTSNGNRVTCYTKSGEFPVEWIDRMIDNQ